MTTPGRPGQLRQLIPTSSLAETFSRGSCGKQPSEPSEVSGRRELTLEALAGFEALKARTTKPRPRGRAMKNTPERWGIGRLDKGYTSRL